MALRTATQLKNGRYLDGSKCFGRKLTHDPNLKQTATLVLTRTREKYIYIIFLIKIYLYIQKDNLTAPLWTEFYTTEK